MGKVKVENGVVVFSIVSILAQASLILSASGKLPPQIPIFYSKPWGEPMLGPPIMLWILPAISAFVILVNFSLAMYLSNNSQFLTRILYFAAFLVSLMTLYDTSKIISLLT